MKTPLASIFFATFFYVFCFLWNPQAASALETVSMNVAKPIWVAGMQKEMNVTVGFRAEFEKPQAEPVVLHVAAASIYRVWLNGKFLACGPARAGHGFYRVDEWKLDGKLNDGMNLLVIEVAGYNSNSYYLLDQPSFLQAEVTAGPDAIAATVPVSDEANLPEETVPFAASTMNYRLQKVQRFSFQRPFMESYRILTDSQRWLVDPAAPPGAVETEECEAKTLLKRRVPYPQFAVQRPVRIAAEGRMVKLDDSPQPHMGREMTDVGPKLKGFAVDELETTPTLAIQRLKSEDMRKIDRKYDGDEPIELAEGDFRILEFEKNYSGFLGATVTCSKHTRLWLVFDEILRDGDVDNKRLGCANMIEYEFSPGIYNIEAIEPYTLKYLKIVCAEGDCSVADVYLREYAHPPINDAGLHASDERINRLFAAGVETFRQNALDIFMDCPSRERAGWLCDSYFTGRTEKILTGGNRIERNFLENFMLPDGFKDLPEGMLPMCYPADHYDGNFIPNWAMFFVLELEEYAARSGDLVMIDGLRAKVMRLLKYFEKYENEDGLLEKLPGWVFVEWSEANKFVQDVNYPTNMLYAAALDSASRLYKEPQLAEKAEKIRETVRRQSFDGEFFVDNAIRKDGKLEATRNRSETCQYFAFYFNVATPQTHAELWKKLCDEFGPQRQKTKKYPDVHKANSFIGNVLRIELLSLAGRPQQILDESLDYLLYMADRTGTLWENDGDYASCNHGFASHACCTLLRDILGIRRVDLSNKKVFIRFAKLDIEYCQGAIPTFDGPIDLHWRKQNGKLVYRLEVPQGYTAEIDNQSGLEAVKE